MPRKYVSRGKRTIEESRAGRVFWQAGQAHPLDVLFAHAEKSEKDLPSTLHALQHTAQHLQGLLAPLISMETRFEEVEESLTAADQAAFQLIAERFAERKHVAHLEAVFAILRRKRLLGRLQALQAALTLATGLLTEEESLSQEYMQSVLAAQIQHEHEVQRFHHGERGQDGSARSPSQEANATEEAGSLLAPLRGQPEMHDLPKEVRRLQGIDEPMAPLVSSVEQSRELLRTFEAQLPALRAQLVEGNGWFEVFYIRKKRLKKAVKSFTHALKRERMKGIPVAQDIEQAVHTEVAEVLRQEGTSSIPQHLHDAVYDYTDYGPYVRYRWNEKKQLYTISLGLTSDYPDSIFF